MQKEETYQENDVLHLLHFEVQTGQLLKLTPSLKAGLVTSGFVHHKLNRYGNRSRRHKVEAPCPLTSIMSWEVVLPFAFLNGVAMYCHALIQIF